MNDVADRAEVWPVIHLQSRDQGLANARLAAACGCTGVFLISMEGRDDIVDPIADAIKTDQTALRVGVNYLTLRADEALTRAIAAGHHATWADDSGVRSDKLDVRALRCADIVLRHPDHPFFAGVAFKYLLEDKDPAKAAATARELGFLPTTTGEKTGSAPPVEKLAAMRSAIGFEAPLGIASGITPDNVAVLGPYLSHILVATGISKSFHDFDEDLLRALMRNRPQRLRA